MRGLLRAGALGSVLLLCGAIAGCGHAGRQPTPGPSVAAASDSVRAAPVSPTTPLQPTSATPSVTVGPSATPAAAPATPSPTRTAEPPPAVDPPKSGNGQFSTAPLAITSPAHGRVVRFAVQVEQGVPVDPMDFATQVYATLTDPRGWQGVDGIAFTAVADPAAAAFIVTLATPNTTDRLCAPLDTGGYLDCFNGRRAVINSDRWLLGAQSWGADITGYRHQVVNHEVGHAIGHGHRYCPAPGQPAPVMQQQTISLQSCAPNAWPSVTGG